MIGLLEVMLDPAARAIAPVDHEPVTDEEAKPGKPEPETGERCYLREPSRHISPFPFARKHPRGKVTVSALLCAKRIRDVNASRSIDCPLPRAKARLDKVGGLSSRSNLPMRRPLDLGRWGDMALTTAFHAVREWRDTLS